MSSKGGDQKPKGSPALTIAGWLTAIYLVLVAIALWWQGQTVATFKEMAPNELGDFLAGVFAPIAFLWLVAAVLIQRRELELTRIEFEMNRTVTEKQATEAERQAQFIGRQTDLLTAESAERAQNRLDELYRERSRSLVLAMNSMADLAIECRDRIGPRHTFETYRLFPRSEYTFDHLLTGLQRIDSLFREREIISAFDPQRLDRLLEVLVSIDDMLPSVSSMAKEDASNYDYRGMIEEVQTVQDWLQQFHEERIRSEPENVA